MITIIRRRELPCLLVKVFFFRPPDRLGGLNAIIREIKDRAKKYDT
ncbi:MAG: hypothetical protein ACLFR2_10030 [Candidatus Kapaibacterium sp.]